MYSILYGFIKYLHLKLTGKEVVVSGRCINCGECCRRINIRHEGLWIRSERKFNKIAAQDPSIAKFRVIGKNSNNVLDFSCTNFGEDNLCTDYENRPDICREFPGKAVYYMESPLPATCGFKVHAGVPFEKVLEKEMKKM